MKLIEIYLQLIDLWKQRNKIVFPSISLRRLRMTLKHYMIKLAKISKNHINDNSLVGLDRELGRMIFLQEKIVLVRI
jgi:hypothetical protein